jgi:methyl-accepting chemotaxis protein
MPSKPTSQNTENGHPSPAQNIKSVQFNTATSTPPRSQNTPTSSTITSPQLEVGEEQIETRKKALSVPWQNWSLRAKAMVLAILVGTAPVVAVGSAAYFIADQSLKRQILDQKQTLGEDTQAKLNLFLDRVYSDVVALSKNSALDNTKVRGALTAQELRELLNAFVEDSQIYDSVVVYDLQGNVIARSDTNVNTQTLLQLDYTQAVLKTNEPVIVDPRPNITTGTFSLFAAAPIKDSVTGQTIAIVRVRAPMNNLIQIFNFNTTRPQSFYITDSQGQITASNQRNLIQKSLKDVFPKLSTQIATQAQQSIVTISQERQLEEILSFTPNEEVRKKYNLNWGIIISEPTDTALAALNQLLFSFSVGTGITALFVLLFAILIANRATRPLLEAANAVEKIGQGELDTRLNVLGQDELAKLGSNINMMADQLVNLMSEQLIAADQARLTFLTGITGSEIRNTQDLNNALSIALQVARETLNADRIVIYRFNDDRSGAVIVESVASGLPHALMAKIEDACIPEDLLTAYSNGRVVSIQDVSKATIHPKHLKLLQSLDVSASLIVPILLESELFGLLIAHQCSTPRKWEESDVAFLQQVSTQFGLAVSRVRFLEQLKSIAEEQRQLKEQLQRRALELLQEVDPISKGDLTIRARVTADEIGTLADSYNAIVSSLRKIVLQVQGAANQVIETTTTSEGAVRELAQEADHQVTEIITALEQVEQMAIAIRQVEVNAEQARIAVQEAEQTVEEGDRAMNRTVEGIQAIRATVAETAKKVKHLGESSQRISTVVELISAFAAQTNMLALNASIEASRAGEEGRGFAVVAEEVRALARQSAEATEEIRKLIANVQIETKEVVTAMEAGTEQVVTGTRLVDETRQSLNRITATSTQINQLVGAIAQATVVQSQASEKMTQTMKDIAAIANKTLTEATQVTASFEHLKGVAQTLQEGVGQFKVN